ncbi:hypothetical protein LOAG_17968 [Loa loa]|uniref:Apple domain-containing protein n=1 Tax=Loa loa TaxID=7209 RepID=A0A1S0UGT1_LOALO|nr:hypothetical protein LOAG_17968 [Loa loa]EJD74763.1 hypothetical protein LOAG_17968 [Loa loa]
MMINQHRQLFIVLIIFHLSLTATSYPFFGNNGFQLVQSRKCLGGKIFEVHNVQDNEQCLQACMYYNGVAFNIIQLGEFEFMCEILGTMSGIIAQPGVACYYLIA